MSIAIFPNEEGRVGSDTGVRQEHRYNIATDLTRTGAGRSRGIVRTGIYQELGQIRIKDRDRSRSRVRVGIGQGTGAEAARVEQGWSWAKGG